MGPDSGWRLIAAYPRHHSRRDRWLMIREQVAEGVPNRYDPLPNHQVIRVTEWSGGKLVVPTLDPKDSEIIHLIDPDELCGVLAPIAQRHEDIIGPADHMLIRQDDPITPDDEA